jgi:predicted molibdopterin-dependent oxidoreductase YjgC
VELSPPADPWIRYLPGGALPLLRALLAARRKDEREKREWTKEAGVAEDQVSRMAEALSEAERLVILIGPEVTHDPKLSLFMDDFRLLIDLRAEKGQRTHIGMLQEACNSQGAADMGLYPDLLPGYRLVTHIEARERLTRLWNIPLPAEAGWTTRQMLQNTVRGGVQAVYLMGANLVADKTLGGIAAEALSRIPFVVVQDLFLTETARLAHWVLPMGSWAEADGSYTNTDRHVQRIRKTVPFAGESRPDWKTFSDLGRSLGYPMEYGSVEEIWDEIAQAAPQVRTGAGGVRIQEEGQWGR